jgi:hypothetical protein
MCLCINCREFDPEYDDPTGAGWVISDEFWDDVCRKEGSDG